MPSTVYKGDLAEVTFGHESGLLLRSANLAGHASGSPQTFTWTSAASGNNSSLTFLGGIANSPVLSAKLRYPEGLLVGSTLTFHASGAHADDDYTTTGQIFTIVANSNATGATVITVSPQLKSTGAASLTGDSLYIHTLGTPTIDVGMAHHTAANQSNETILADQFVGLAATITLPDTKTELKRSHVVGIGRDVVVQVPGKQTNEGGSLEIMMNNPRWLYYALGAESVKDTMNTYDVVNTTTAAASTAGDSHIDVTALTSFAIGDYIALEDNTAHAELPVDFTTAGTVSSPTAANTFPDGAGPYKWHEKTEIRRVVAMSDGVIKTIWLDDPLCFSHASGEPLQVVRFAVGSTNGPDVDKDTLEITNPTTRLLYSNWHTPSFCIETSIRTRNIGAHSQETGLTVGDVGTATDANTLTRIFRGCKVKEWGITADADAEVKLNIGFDSTLVYTDTGRKEGSNPGDRYTAHRMFENTADSTANRKVAGIAPYTQKPYLFYNGIITAFGQTMARVTKFNLTGKNNTVLHHTVRGADIAMNSTTDQVPFAGTRMPVMSIEGKTEYELSMEVIINDALLWDELRFAKERDYLAPITLTLIKQGSGTVREKIVITIDDYFVVEAPLPIPEDKGVIRTECKIMPKHVSIESVDTMFHC